MNDTPGRDHYWAGVQRPIRDAAITFGEHQGGFLGNENFIPSPPAEELEVGDTVSTPFLSGGIITMKDRNGEEWRYWVMFPGNNRPGHFPATSLKKAPSYSAVMGALEEATKKLAAAERDKQSLSTQIEEARVTLNEYAAELRSKRYKKDRIARKSWNAALASVSNHLEELKEKK